jgi:hypothetical protein
MLTLDLPQAVLGLQRALTPIALERTQPSLIVLELIPVIQAAQIQIVDLQVSVLLKLPYR